MVLKIDSSHSDGLSNRGCFYFNMQEFDSAIHYYAEAGRMMPSNATAFFFCATAHYKKGSYREAIINYKKAIRILPDYADAYAYMGLCFVNLDNFDSALYCVNRAEAITSISGARKVVSTEYLQRGTTSFHENNIEEALRFYTNAYEILPTNAEAVYNIGGVYFFRKNLAKAREYWQKTIAVDPNHAAANEWLTRTGGIMVSSGKN